MTWGAGARSGRGLLWFGDGHGHRGDGRGGRFGQPRDLGYAGRGVVCTEQRKNAADDNDDVARLHRQIQDSVPIHRNRGGIELLGLVSFVWSSPGGEEEQE